MATYAKILKDPSGNQILPYTRSELVYMDDGRTLNNFTGANSSTSGQSGLVPGPDINNREYRKYLCDNGKWESLVAGGWYFSDFVLKNPNGYIRVDSNKKITQIYHVHINGNMVHVVFRVNLAKDAVANSMSNTILFTLENMPSIWAEGANGADYATGAGVIGTAYGTNSSGMHLSYCTIENTTVSNASNYRFGNGINVYLTTSFTYPAGNGLLGEFIYYSNSII